VKFFDEHGMITVAFPPNVEDFRRPLPPWVAGLRFTDALNRVLATKGQQRVAYPLGPLFKSAERLAARQVRIDATGCGIPAFGDQPSSPSSFYRDFTIGTTFRTGLPIAAAIVAPMVSEALRSGSSLKCA
jgi:hypothetical protein